MLNGRLEFAHLFGCISYTSHRDGGRQDRSDVQLDRARLARALLILAHYGSGGSTPQKIGSTLARN